MYYVLNVFHIFFKFVFETIYEIVKFPFQYITTKVSSLLKDQGFYHYNSKVEEVIEVIQTLKRKAGSSQELAELEAAAQLLKKSSSLKDLAAIGLPKALSLRDTNSFTSSHWISQNFPDLFWAFTSYVNSEFPVPPHSQRNQIKKKVLNSQEVKEAIKVSASKTNRSERQVKQHAAKIFEEMASDPRMFIMRIMSYFLRKILRVLYPFGMNVAVEDLEKVKETARTTPIVYFPCHKSYLDFLVISYICFSHGLPYPHVVSGENLNITLVGRLLRYGGAFFIKRTFGNDELYRTIFNEYVRQLLIHGNCIECFIEGGRSRTGKVLHPKPGFARVVVDAVADGIVDDVHIIPISIVYDKVVENYSHIKELTGGEKQAEKLYTLLTSSFQLLTKAFKNKLCFGQINIGFGEPISIKKYLLNERSRLSDITSDQRKQLTRNLGYRTLYEINYSRTILTATLVGTVLLTQYGRGIRHEELLKRVKWLRKEVLTRGGRVQQQSDDEIASGLNSIMENVFETSTTSNSKKTRLVKRHKLMLMLSLYSPAEQMELALYRNQLIHYFVSEGVISCAMYACEKNSTSSPALVSKQDLFEKAEFLSKLLRLEFIYKPSPTINETFDNTISFMIRRNVFEQSSEDNYCVNENPPNEESGGTFVYLFLCSLFWPFIDSYWLASACLLRLLPNRMLDEKTWIRFVQEVGERLYFEGLIDLYEAISHDTLNNALVLFESWKMIQFINIEGQPSQPGKRVIQLTPEFRNGTEIEAFAEKLGVYRKHVSAYRSRRFKGRCDNYVIDAIQYIKAHSATTEK